MCNYFEFGSGLFEQIIKQMWLILLKCLFCPFLNEYDWGLSIKAFLLYLYQSPIFLYTVQYMYNFYFILDIRIVYQLQ